MRLFRFIIVFLFLVIISLLLHLALYRTDFSYENMANALFVVNIIVFLPTFVVLFGGFEVFQGISYALKVLVNPSYRHTFPKFSDYKESREVKINTGIFYEILISAFLLIVLSYIFAGLV